MQDRAVVSFDDHVTMEVASAGRAGVNGAPEWALYMHATGTVL